MKKRPVIIFLALVVTTLFYLTTAIVFDEGGDQLHLVIKPHPTIQAVYGGGEEGSWERAHPGEIKPWWLVEHYTVVTSETLFAYWQIPYIFGYYLTVLSWPVFALLLFIKSRRKRNNISPNTAHA